MPKIYDDIKETVLVSSDIIGPCEKCGEKLHDGEVEKGINHYIQKHGFHLLHVGTETGENHGGKIYHATVAVLGLKK